MTFAKPASGTRGFRNPETSLILESEDVALKEVDLRWAFQASLVAQRVKHLPAMWETWVQSLSQEDLLEKGMVTPSGVLA